MGIASVYKNHWLQTIVWPVEDDPTGTMKVCSNFHCNISDSCQYFNKQIEMSTRWQAAPEKNCSNHNDLYFEFIWPVVVADNFLFYGKNP